MDKEYFSVLNAVNVNEHTEEKNGLTYLSWAWAVAEVLKKYPSMTYTIWKDEKNRPYIFDEELGYMVFTSVTIEGETKEMWLPVMDGANKAMKNEPYDYIVKNKNFKYAKLNKEDGKYYDRYGNEQPEYLEKTCEAATMFDINTAIMRCLVKNFAMFGLGLYIYAGEDLPEDQTEKVAPTAEDEEKQKKIYIDTISQLLSDTDTDGVQMIEYVNSKFNIKAQAWTELNAEQLIYAMKMLDKKKAKAAK